MKLLTAREVAERFNLKCTETVLRWVRHGKLPAIRLPGGAIRFREEDIESCLASWATPSRGALTTPQDAAQRLGYFALTTPEVEEDP